MSTDVLTQARTPTEAEELAGWIEPSGATTAGDVLELAAPRILSLAYRDAARIAVDGAMAQRRGEWCEHELQALADKLLALATALEEGT